MVSSLRYLNFPKNLFLIRIAKNQKEINIELEDGGSFLLKVVKKILPTTIIFGTLWEVR